MNRLTKKAQFVRNLITGKEIKYISNESDQMCVDKLGKLEDIEEEIDIDFITLIKILKEDVYINDGGIVDEIGNIYKEQVKSIERWPVWGFTVGDNVEYAFRDRGKTWALDKEEFYKNIK